jgi:plasmid rolling circle replication initiator protein Rep
MGTANYIPEEENTIFDLSNSNGFQPWLGIDHANKKNFQINKIIKKKKTTKIYDTKKTRK